MVQTAVRTSSSKTAQKKKITKTAVRTTSAKTPQKKITKTAVRTTSAKIHPKSVTGGNRSGSISGFYDDLPDTYEKTKYDAHANTIKAKQEWIDLGSKLKSIRETEETSETKERALIHLMTIAWYKHLAYKELENVLSEKGETEYMEQYKPHVEFFEELAQRK
jgi:hypothetical protein